MEEVYSLLDKCWNLARYYCTYIKRLGQVILYTVQCTVYSVHAARGWNFFFFYKSRFIGFQIAVHVTLSTHSLRIGSGCIGPGWGHGARTQVPILVLGIIVSGDLYTAHSQLVLFHFECYKTTGKLLCIQQLLASIFAGNETVFQNRYTRTYNTLDVKLPRCQGQTAGRKIDESQNWNWKCPPENNHLYISAIQPQS